MGNKGSFTFISFPWQSKYVQHKRYSDYNSAAMMLDRTRGGGGGIKIKNKKYIQNVSN